MEAEAGPVHHLAHGPGLLRVRGGGRVRGLPQHEDGLVLHLAADVEAGGHLPAAPPEPGQEAAQEPPGLVLQKVPSEANPKVRNHGEGPY